MRKKENRVIWDIGVIAYMINKKWFEVEEKTNINIELNLKYCYDKNSNININFVKKINSEKIYEDLILKINK